MSSGNDWFDDNIPEDIASTIVRVKVNLPKKKSIERDFRPDVAVDYDNLEVQLEEIPSSFAFWSSVLAEHRAVAATVERKIKARRAALANQLLEKAKLDGIKIAQWQVEMVTEIDDKLIEFESELILVNRTLSKLYAVVDAIRMKSDNLRSLAGFKREELKESR
jgi:hypothetical protein